MKRKFTAGVIIVLFLMALVFFLSLCWGSYRISIREVMGVLAGRGTKLQNTAVLSIRLPRILTGIFAGAALAVSGGILQTMTKNDLADPGIIGINAGGAVAAVLFIQLSAGSYYSELGKAAIYALPLMAVTGSMAAALFIYILSSRKGLKPRRLLLMGIGVNAGLNAFIIFHTFRGGPGEYNKILIWTTGSLWGAGWAYTKILIPVVSVVFLYVLWKCRTMDVMNFSDEVAVGLGVSVEQERRKMLICAVVLAGSATAFAGNFGFIGLIAPHIARKLAGSGHRKVLLLSAGVASIIMVAADTGARNLFSPVEIPAGIAVSIIGVPYFVYLLLRENQ